MLGSVFAYSSSSVTYNLLRVASSSFTLDLSWALVAQGLLEKGSLPQKLSMVAELRFWGLPCLSFAFALQA